MATVKRCSEESDAAGMVTPGCDERAVGMRQGWGREEGGGGRGNERELLSIGERERRTGGALQMVCCEDAVAMQQCGSGTAAGWRRGEDRGNWSLERRTRGGRREGWGKRCGVAGVARWSGNAIRGGGGRGEGSGRGDGERMKGAEDGWACGGQGGWNVAGKGLIPRRRFKWGSRASAYKS